MFKKTLKELKDFIDKQHNQMLDDVDIITNSISTLSREIKGLEPTEKDVRNLNLKIDKLNNVIQSQQKTINTLVEALCDKFEHGLFVYSNDGEIPFVIRNGQQLTNKMTTSFDISWAFDHLPRIDIGQDCTTSDDMSSDEELKYFCRKAND